MVDGGLKSKPEAMVRFWYCERDTAENWCELYREGGAQALKPKLKGRPKGVGAGSGCCVEEAGSACVSLRRRWRI